MIELNRTSDAGQPLRVVRAEDGSTSLTTTIVGIVLDDDDLRWLFTTAIPAVLAESGDEDA